MLEETQGLDEWVESIESSIVDRWAITHMTRKATTMEPDNLVIVANTRDGIDYPARLIGWHDGDPIVQFDRSYRYLGVRANEAQVVMLFAIARERITAAEYATAADLAWKRDAEMEAHTEGSES